MKKFAAYAKMGDRTVEFTVEADDKPLAYEQIHRRLKEDGMWPKELRDVITVRFWEVVA